MKALCICDKPGWALDLIAGEITKRCPIEFRAVYFRNASERDIEYAAEGTDFVWVMNWGMEKYCGRALERPFLYGFHSWAFSRQHVEFARTAAAVIVPSLELRDQLWWWGLNAHRVRNGVDPHAFNGRRPRIGFVGNMDVDAKGFALLSEACSRLGHDYEIQVAGHEKQGVKGSDYRIVPHYEHHQMPGWYAGLDCLVVMSESEGFSLPVIEAMAMNVPVISTDVGVAREVPGLRCSRTVESLVSTLRMLFGRHYALEYSWDEAAREFMSVVETQL